MRELVEYAFNSRVTVVNGWWMLTVEARAVGSIPVTASFPLNVAYKAGYESKYQPDNILQPAEMGVAAHKAGKFIEAFLSEPANRDPRQL